VAQPSVFKALKIQISKRQSVHGENNIYDSSGGFRLGPGGGHKPPKSCPVPHIFNWFYFA